MNGTEKQMAWAQNIMNSVFGTLDAYIDGMEKSDVDPATIQGFKETRKSFEDLFASIKYASQIIDRKEKLNVKTVLAVANDRATRLGGAGLKDFRLQHTVTIDKLQNEHCFDDFGFFLSVGDTCVLPIYGLSTYNGFSDILGKPILDGYRVPVGYAHDNAGKAYAVYYQGKSSKYPIALFEN